MNQNLKFLNDVVKPWDELNKFLLEPYAVQPDLSDLTLKAGNLATNISHYPEHIGRKRLFKEGKTYLAKIDDIADSFKHNILDKQQRQYTLSVASMFECNDSNQFLFLRNVISAKHKTYGKIDLMTFMLEVINFWKNELNISCENFIEENISSFSPTAKLKYDSKFCIQMDSTNILFVKRATDGKLYPCAPTEVRFELY